ncbi:Zinc finger BED domain-containing protein 1 [Acipenser ruthenus]|uniref:Zinc finger BED domain-containing protein 1 n=1 Tax=Acipenser ruthenus TaxID=7906 RepID=A0A444UHR3_ACIRT|nr:Zinc finger BED domain-containing protein 1 [Acipenser ruthenus]
MLFRDLHPVSVVEERGFKLLLGCLEPSFRAPPRSHLSGMLWHRHSVQRQLLQGYLRAGVGRGGAAVLCTDHWGATESGGGYLTVSVLFVDRDWRLARCVLETRPAPEPQGLRDALGGALAQFGLPESSVLGVVLDRPGPSLCVRSPGGLSGWQGLPCAALWLGECVAEALSLDPVQEALAAARVIVTHFQQDPGSAALLNPDEAGAGGSSSSKARLPPPDQPARWVTTLAMCEGLLELRWVVSSVLEGGGGSPPVPNLADHQWRLLQELLPALRTVRLAASFLSEEPNASVSALLPCLHGAARLLGSQLGECGLQAARSAIGRMRGAMQKRWRIGEGEGEGEDEGEEEEEMLLDSPLVLSSFLDPRFKELRFLSPDARSRLHGRVKELLSAQREEGEEEAGEGEGAGGGGESSPMSCVSAEGHDLQAGGEGCRISMVVVGAHGNSQWSPPPPPPQSVYDVLLGEDPTERMPAIQQQLENYIAEPLCKRSCSPLDWWRSKQLRFPALAGLARRYLAFPSTAVPPERAFAPQESPALRRRATLAPEHLDQILFLNQNCDFIEGLRGGATGTAEHRGGQAHARETLYQSLVSFESQA